MDEVDSHLNRLKGPFLWAAAKGGRAEEVQSLIVSHGADVNWHQIPYEEQGDADYSGDSVLIMAVRNRHLDVVKVLLAHGANIDSRCTDRGDTVLHIAASLGDDDICNLILEARRDMAFSTNNYGQTPISIALKQGFPKLSEHLKYAPLEGSSSPSGSYLKANPQNMVSSTRNNEELASLFMYNRDSRRLSRLAQIHHSHEKRRNRLTAKSKLSQVSSVCAETNQKKNMLSDRFNNDVSNEEVDSNSNSCIDDKEEVTSSSFTRLKHCKSSFRSINMEEEYAEFFAEVDLKKLSEFEAASQNVNIENQDDVVAQLTGLWIMVKHFRKEKRNMEARAEALEVQYNTLVFQIESLQKVNEEYKVNLDTITNELNIYQGKAIIENKSIKDLDQLETKLRSSLRIIKDAKEKAMSNILREEEEGRMCVICQEERKSVLLMPCRHLCCCKDCSRRSELIQCPLCRNAITQKIDVFS